MAIQDYRGPMNDEAQTTDEDVASTTEAPDEANPSPSDTPAPVTLDKSNPEIAAAFEGCKVGDTYTVTEDTPETITLTKEYGEEAGEEPEEGGGTSMEEGSGSPVGQEDTAPAVAMILKNGRK